MTYLNLLDSEWDSIKDILTESDEIKLQEINEAHIAMEPGKNTREHLRRWCSNKDTMEREKKLKDLGL